MRVAHTVSGIQFENGTNTAAGEILLTRKNKKDWKETTIELPAGSAFLLAVTGGASPPRATMR
jgi:hypothetical protein